MLIPNLDFGGAQRSFCSLANALFEIHTVSVVVFNTSHGISFPLDPSVIDLNIPAGKHIFSKIYFFLKRCQLINRLKKDLQIDTTISYLEGANYINSLTGKDRKIISVRGSKYYDDNINGFLGWMRKKVFMPLVYRKADFVVSLNNGIKKELVDQIGLASSKVGVIRNFYNVGWIQALAYAPLDPCYEFLTEKPYLIYAGRLVSGKGLISILDVLSLLKKEYRDLRLVIIGAGPIMGKLIQYAVSKKLKVYSPEEDNQVPIIQADILFLGYQSNPYQFIKNASMLLLASTSEGGPNILMESLICGTLVVSTDCPYGPGELLAPELKGVPVKVTTVGSYGILLPKLTRDNYATGIRLWSMIISDFIRNEEQREAILSRVNQWVTEHAPDLILENWKRII